MGRLVLIEVVAQKKKGVRFARGYCLPDSFLWRIVASAPAEGYREPFFLTKGRGGPESIVSATNRTIFV